MCWLCTFRETNPTVEQERMARQLFESTIDLLDQCADSTGSEESLNAAWHKASDTINQKPEKVPKSVLADIASEIEKLYGGTVVEFSGGKSQTVNHGRRSTDGSGVEDNVVPINGKGTVH